MRTVPLANYVLAVIVVLALGNCIAWFVGGPVKLTRFAIFSGGFLMGMLAMYIAVHLYRWK